MNDSLSAVRSRDRDRLEFDVRGLPAADAHLSLSARISLRLGIWLLLRSARSVRHDDAHETHHRRRSNERARLAREQAAVREHLLSALRV